MCIRDSVSPDKSKRQENIDLTKHQIEVAYALGIPTIRINTGRWGTTMPTNGKSEFDVLMDNKGVEPVIDGYTEDDGFKWVIDSIAQCIPTAEKCGVVLGLENHWGLGLTSQGVMRIVNEINSPWLKVTLDTGNFFDNREAQLQELAPHTCLIQAKTYFGGAKWPAFNEINIDYPKIGELMRKNNYRGYISLEFEGNENAETADTTHKPPRGTIAAAYKTQTATTKNFELSVEGKTNYDDPGFKELFTKGRATTPVNLRFTTAESLATPGTFYGYTFSAIPNIQHDFPLEDSVGYSLGFILQSEPVYSENLA